MLVSQQQQQYQKAVDQALAPSPATQETETMKFNHKSESCHEGRHGTPPKKKKTKQTNKQKANKQSNKQSNNNKKRPERVKLAGRCMKKAIG